MAAKPQNGENVQVGQVEKQSLELIEVLCKKHKINPAVYAGACAMNGWKTGKAVTEKEFLDGVAVFNRMPVNHSQGKKARESKC